MIRIGLTGGIGSGKSTVAARLAELGASAAWLANVSNKAICLVANGRTSNCAATSTPMERSPLRNGVTSIVRQPNSR